MKENKKSIAVNGKLIFGFFLVFLFILAAVVIFMGVADVLSSSENRDDGAETVGNDDKEDNEDNNNNNNNNSNNENNSDNNGEDNENPGDDEDTVVPPIPEHIIGVEGELKEIFEGEELPDHAIVLQLEESPEYNENGLKVRLFFGTSLSSDGVSDADKILVKLLLEKEGLDPVNIEEISGRDFYNGRYALALVEETEDESTVKKLSYIRVIEVTVPPEYLSENSGEMLFSLSVSLVDEENESEETCEVVADSLFYKKKGDGITLSHEKEKTTIYSYEYKTDISELIDYIEPTGDLWSNDYLLLVNPWNALEKGEEFTYGVVAPQSKMSAVKSIYNFSYLPSIKLNTTALNALAAMFREAVETTGLTTKNLQVTSSYRDYATQKTIFERNVKNTKKYVCNNAECLFEYITKYSYDKCKQCGSTVTNVTITKEEAEANVKTYSCAPGTSEHQTGLVVDVIDRNYSTDLIEGFKNTEAGKWLAANCNRFGFILRFEKEKEDITGIIYEPWHFRYVGRYHATRMTELGMCLEEYVEFLTEEGYFEDPDSVHNPANMEIDRETYLIVDKK
ncbi:MAG: M15 family metallopeptidase [Clostridia bacterium]|nr:M15 family metallopeptidase [Clostridia bacterium]